MWGSEDSGDVALVILRHICSLLSIGEMATARGGLRLACCPFAGPLRVALSPPGSQDWGGRVKHLLEATHTAARSPHTQLTTCQLCPLLSHPRPSVSPSCLSLRLSLFFQPPILLFSLNRSSWFRGASPCALDWHTQGIPPFMSLRPPLYMAHCAASCYFYVFKNVGWVTK